MRELKQVKISIPPDIAAEFKKSCSNAGASMASVLSKFMSEYSKKKKAATPKKAPDYSTKRQRRTAIKKIVGQLEQIRDSEESYRDNIPENLAGSSVYDAADEAVSLLDEAIEKLEDY